MTIIYKVLIVALAIKLTLCSISGISYMDPLNQRPLPGTWPRGEDPCNPLYWYPRHIPDYCNYLKNPPRPIEPQLPIPMPLPVHQPYPVPMPFPMMPMPPLPYGVPIFPPTPLLPVSGYPYPPFQQPIQNYGYRRLPQAGMVPGVPGLVSPDGGINVLPFSDAYADLLEKHKQKMVRKHMEKYLKKYNKYPRGRGYRRSNRHSKRRRSYY